MNNRRALFAQAIRGPILLITIGILFAIHQAGVVSFSMTWPVILIVFGVLKLFERMALQSDQRSSVQAPPAPGAGGPLR
jgi:hypothetical protein